jgi:outer membrane protein OmpA-like peptidoglycan-associated protein
VARPQEVDLPASPQTAASLPADSLFATGSHELRPGATAALETVAAQIHLLAPSASLHFVGHADSRGDADSNQTLSEQRAQTVLNWFRGHGFSSNVLIASGVGSTQPLIPDTDSSGTFIPSAGQKNRRVDIIIGQ